MRMIPLETKYRAIVHYEKFLRSIRKVSKIYGVSRSSLHRWLQSSGNGLRKRRQKKAIRQDIADCIADALKRNPCMDMHQICAAIQASCPGVRQSSTDTVGRWVRALGFTRKKVKAVIEYNPSAEQTDAFCSKYKELEDDRIVCIDEAGFYVTVTRPEGNEFISQHQRPCDDLGSP
jgi:transposase